MQDRNKTGLTHDVTAVAASWLDLHGFKPIETEVPLCLGWCSDLAAVITPTQTELIDLKLLRRKPRWTWNRKRYEVDDSDAASWQAEYKALDRVMTCCVEVKTSRGDFRRDKKWTFALPTDMAYLAAPKGLTQPEEWPKGWGILEFESDVIHQLRPPTPGVTTTEQQLGIVLSIALRRDHNTRYERIRELQKSERIEDGEQRAITRTGDIARLVLSVAHAEYESVERTLERYRRTNLPPWVMEPLKKLYGVAKNQEN